MECEFGSRTGAYRDGLKFIIDEGDYDEFVKGYRFRVSSKGYVRYSSTKDGLHNKFLHRVMMGEPTGMQVDHKNLNTLDNRRENLRVCTHQQNLWNTKKKSNNTSGFKGVSVFKPTQKFVARISINGKYKTLGYFATAEAAHEAYKRGAIQHHGEFARF